MLGKNKFISSLDLKYLDAKFTPIYDSHMAMNANLSQIRKSKTLEYPSIHKTQQYNEETTLNSTLLEPLSKTEPIDYSQYMKRISPAEHQEAKAEMTHEKEEINKYRKMISKIKSDNQLIHREITNLYRQKKLCDQQPKIKQIKTILEAVKGCTEKTSFKRLSPELKRFDRIYEGLNNQKNPYHSQSLQIQKKFANNNLHKNFETFLITHNKRVPQFIKNIR